jgi:tryptophanyl-tRNA synthetase
MSKSYDNHIPLFAPREQLKKLIAGIVTDSRAPGQPKESQGSALFQIYQAFASTEETLALRQAYADGISWADAKQLLFERIDHELSPMRDAYLSLMDHPAKVEAILLAGADKARKIAIPFMSRLRHAVGMRDLRSQERVKVVKLGKSNLPVFKQYRESDGQFYFKLLAADGRVFLQSVGYSSPRVSGQTISLLQTHGSAALPMLSDQLIWGTQVTPEDIETALQALSDARAR